MEPASLEHHPKESSSSPTWPACSYWKRVAVDALLKLAAGRQQLDSVDEDLVELVARDRYRFYQAIGGTELTIGAFKAKTRHAIRTGEWI